MVREKTPLLLAFGRHGKSRKVKGFFREEIGPFIDQFVVKEGRKAAIIYELLLSYVLPSGAQNHHDVGRFIKQEGLERAKTENKIKRELCDLYKHESAELRSTSNNGDSLKSVLLNLWGFGPCISEIESQNSGLIEHYIEPQDVRTTYFNWEFDFEKSRMAYALSNFDHDGQIQAIIDHTKKMVELHTLRDNNVKDLVIKLRENNPSRAIIVPRGTAHRGMVFLFDPDLFDVHFRSAGYQLDFSEALLADSYCRMPSEEEFRLCAERQLAYMRAYGAKARTPLNLFLRLFGFSELVEIKSHDYAWSKVNK